MTLVLERFSGALESLLKRIFDYVSHQANVAPSFGLCVVNPKQAFIGPPSREVQVELEGRATEHFRSLGADAYYFQYWTPPVLPTGGSRNSSSCINVDDYHVEFDLPKFDEKWKRHVRAQGLVYCPSDMGQHGWNDWFELQHEAIRLTPLLHQNLKECEILTQIQLHLGSLGVPIFEDFIYEYALQDLNLPPIQKSERKQWEQKEMDWKSRYPLIANLFPLNSSLRDVYLIARSKAATSRNPIIKDLLWAFVEKIENCLVLKTELSEEVKKLQLADLRNAKRRESKKGRYIAKRPVFCISYMECGQILYAMIQAFLSSKSRNRILAEAIIFVWIAQHGAFSEINLKVEDILEVKFKNIHMQSLTISLKSQTIEVEITGGLAEILQSFSEDTKKENRRKLFSKLSYDNLEEVLNKYSKKLYGVEGSLLPKDVLSKVHVVPGARISLDLRRQITAQESLVKASPYRVNSKKIKKCIQEEILKQPIKSSS